MLLIAFLGLLGLATTTADDDFLGGPDTLTTDPQSNASYVEASLGQPLPPGVVVDGILEGGFQERFVYIKMTAPETELHSIFDLLAVDNTTFRETGPAQSGIDAPWWTINQHPGLFIAPATFGHFPQATISLAPDPADATVIFIYLFAHET